MTGPFQSETESLLADLIALPTISSESNLEMIALLANLLGDCGCHVEIQTDDSGTKANLLARLGPAPLLIEWDTDVPAWAELRDEAARADAALSRARRVAA